VLVLSESADSEDVVEALAAGAFAYIVKTARPEEFAAAIRQSFRQSIYFSPALVDTPQPLPPADAEGAPQTLTPRELEILRLVAEGHSNSQLGQMLWITEQTVKFHLSNVYRKLGVANRTEASRWAEKHGLLGDVAPAVSVAYDVS
jgi:two-component system, NarL family, response regulator DevR